MPKKESVKVETPEGVRFRERLTTDEQDRAVIRQGLDGKRARDARRLMRALARSGEITDADFPIVGYQKLDGSVDYDLDEDDAFMTGNRP